MHFCVEQIKYNKEVSEFIKKNHYTETAPAQVKACYCLFDDGRLVGVITFSNFSRLQAQYRYYGCLELSRLFLVDGLPKNTASWFISRALKGLAKDDKVFGVVSYADTTEGHEGTVYKAANFVQIGVTKPSYHYLDQEGKRIHKRQVWARAQKNERSERMQASLEGLSRIVELPKNVFLYKFKELPKVEDLTLTDRVECGDFVRFHIGKDEVLVDKDDEKLLEGHKWMISTNR
jgi:hypothetical protein